MTFSEFMLAVIAVVLVFCSYRLNRIHRTLKGDDPPTDYYPSNDEIARLAAKNEKPSLLVRAHSGAFSDERMLGIKKHHWTVAAFAFAGLCVLFWVAHVLPN